MATTWSLDADAFDGLPCKRFPRKESAACAICHEDFAGGAAKLLPCASFSACPSFFHTDCLHQWLGRQLSCPLCRRSFEGELGAPEDNASQCSSVYSRPVSVGTGDSSRAPTQSLPSGSLPFLARTDAVIGQWQHESMQPDAQDWDSLWDNRTMIAPGWRVHSSAAQTVSVPSPLRRTDGWAIEPSSTASSSRTGTRHSPSRFLSQPSRAGGGFGNASTVRTGMPWVQSRRQTSSAHLFTNLDRLDMDTRRTMQRRVATLHRLQGERRLG